MSERESLLSFLRRKLAAQFVTRFQVPAASARSVCRSPDYEKGRERGGVPSSHPPHFCEVCGRDEGDLCDSCADDVRIQDEIDRDWLRREDEFLYTIPLDPRRIA